MSKIIRERIDSASMKKYTKTKSKQQMYSFGGTVNQNDNAFTRNDMNEVGYKTQQHSPLGHIQGLYAQQVKTHDSHNSKPSLQFQNVNTTQRPGPGIQPHHERQNSHVVPVHRLQSGSQKMAPNKSKKGIIPGSGYNQYQGADSSKLQQNGINNRVQSPIIMNQQQHQVKGTNGSIRSSLNNVVPNQGHLQSPPTGIY